MYAGAWSKICLPPEWFVCFSVSIYNSEMVLGMEPRWLENNFFVKMHPFQNFTFSCMHRHFLLLCAVRHFDLHLFSKHIFHFRFYSFYRHWTSLCHIYLLVPVSKYLYVSSTVVQFFPLFCNFYPLPFCFSFSTFLRSYCSYLVQMILVVL